MKKLRKVVEIMFLTLISCFIQSNNVKAETLEMRYVDNVYYVHVNNDGTGYSSYQLSMFYIDGKLAYCIEPGLAIYSLKYNSGDWNITSLSPEQRRKIELIGFYGYEYPEHQGNVKYYMAAQELIWKVAKPLSATWSTEKRGGGQIINIEKEKNEIERLISNHSIKPSFDGKTIESVVGDTISLNDDNNVLSKFDIYSSGNQTASIDGNTLNLKINSTGTDQIKLKIKKYDEDVNIVYYNSNSQKLAHTRLSDPVYSILNIKSVAGTVKINKTDSDTKNNKPQGEASLKGAIYGIYNENNEYITSVSTDELGQGISINLPTLGRYYLLEEKASNGYKLDPNKYFFDISTNQLHPEVQVFEDVIKRTFQFTKVYANNKTDIMTPEVGVKFGIYNNKNELVKTIITDKQGSFDVTLPYGNYVVKQLTSTKGYEKAEDFSIEVKETGEPIRKVISNAEITAKLKVVKIDEDTKQVIKRKNIKFKIYNVDTKEYVKQTITYPIAKTIDVFETNSNGILITPYPLKSGTYYLEEVDQKIDGYLWNKNSVEFKIGEDSNLINDKEFGILFEVKFENKAVKGSLELTKTGEKVELTNNGYIYTKINLKGVKIGLYASENIYDALGNLKYKKDTLVKEFITDENGYVKVDDLYLGKYYLQEIETVNNHVLDKTKYEFELKYKDQYTEVINYKTTLENHLPKGTLEFTKSDYSNSKTLPNTLIEIYNENDELVYSGRTDENGKIIIDKLPVGKYYILEKEAPEGYKINEKKMYFEITEDGQVVKCNMLDEAYKVPSTGLSNINYELIGSIVLIISGLGLLLYEKNKKK